MKPRPARSGSTFGAIRGIVDFEHQLGDDLGLVSSLMSMIRAIGNGDHAGTHAACHASHKLLPPEPASSTKTTYGLPLIFMLIVCCAVAPSFQKELLMSLTCGLGSARLDLAQVVDQQSVVRRDAVVQQVLRP